MSPNDISRDAARVQTAPQPRPVATLSGRRWATGHTPPRLVTFSWGAVSTARTRR